ncbi:hypothetical protein ILUMI_12199 [Ignelater luminosus]|uniref:Uncharacterized protein n=1 Tax=Ignelater luminosus TaxID=2038154 RepID=A0A8K0CWY3_IGNLU|nr:hypothetical protein ILUMI_12199 [Ignelater luminosus]
MQKLILSLFLVTIFVTFSEQKLVVQGVLQKWALLIDPYVSKCVRQTGIDREIFLSTFRRGEFPDEACFKCTLKCLATEQNFMDNVGNFNSELIVKKVYGVTEEIVKMCEQSQTPDICQRAYDFAVCAFSSIGGQIPWNDKKV